MNNPHLTFSISDDNELVIRHHRDPSKNRVFQMELPLSELEARGFDGAVKAIGILTLDLLSMWYPDQFAEFSILKPPETALPD